MAGKYAATSKGLNLSPRTRAYLYRVMTAAGAVALVYGFISGEELGVWLTLAGVALGTTSGLAHANVPKLGE
jgi:hypothetical protein